MEDISLSEAKNSVPKEDEKIGSDTNSNSTAERSRRCKNPLRNRQFIEELAKNLQTV